MALNPIEVTQALFTADAEARRIRDEEWRAWLERLKSKFGHADSWARLERDDPPPDKR